MIAPRSPEAHMAVPAHLAFAGTESRISRIGAFAKALALAQSVREAAGRVAMHRRIQLVAPKWCDCLAFTGPFHAVHMGYGIAGLYMPGFDMARCFACPANSAWAN